MSSLSKPPLVAKDSITTRRASKACTELPPCSTPPHRWKPLPFPTLPPVFVGIVSVTVVVEEETAAGVGGDGVLVTATPADAKASWPARRAAVSTTHSSLAVAMPADTCAGRASRAG